MRKSVENAVLLICVYSSLSQIGVSKAPCFYVAKI